MLSITPHRNSPSKNRVGKGDFKRSLVSVPMFQDQEKSKFGQMHLQTHAIASTISLAGQSHDGGFRSERTG